MIFLEQLRRTFFQTIFLGVNEGVKQNLTAEQSKQDTNEYKSQEWYKKGTPEEQESYDKLLQSKGEILKDLIKTIDTLESEAKFKGRSEKILANFLSRNPETPEDSLEDKKEMQKLSEKVEMMKLEVGEDKGALEDFKVEIERMVFLEKLSQTPDGEKPGLAKTFGKKKLLDWSKALSVDVDAKIPSTSGDLKTIEGLLKMMDLGRLSEGEVQQLQGMDNNKFLEEFTSEARLSYITHPRIEASSLSEGKNISTTFTFGGKFNEELYIKTTAGQVFGKDIGTLSVGGTEYTRRGLKGEFYSEKGTRLKIEEGTNITIGKIRTKEDFTRLNQDSTALLEGIDKSDSNYDIALAAANRGVDGKLAIALFKGRIKEGNRPVQIEQIFTDFGRILGQNNMGFEKVDAEGIKSNPKLQSLIVSLFALNANGKNTSMETVSVGGKEYKLSGWQKEMYDVSRTLGFGVSIESIAGSGVGKELVKFLSARGFAPFDANAYMCGKNVGEALLAFGISGLPRSGRNGTAWSNIMRARPDKFQKLNVTAENAPAGAIISYRAGTGGSVPRQKYGHVEIALGSGKYYFGKVASRPGGSRRNPPTGTYEVYMPTSK